MKDKIIDTIPDILIHQLKMGEGTLFYNENEIIISVNLGGKRLPCGCPAGENIRVIKNNEKVYEIIKNEDFNVSNFKILTSSYFSNKEWDDFWDKFYIKYRYLKPHVIFMNN